MEIKFKIKYEYAVIKKDIPKLSQETRERIKKMIETKLMTYPETFGKPLKFSMYGSRTLRVGDYRVIFIVEKKTVKILSIKHRSEIYK